MEGEREKRVGEAGRGRRKRGRGWHLGEEKAMDKVDRFMCTRTTLESWVREI